MNHKPTPQGEEMSKHPPRVSVRMKEQRFTTNTKGLVAHAVIGERTGYLPYLSLSEAQEMAERARAEGLREAMGAVMDLYFALREIGGSPTLKDLLKLARRIRPAQSLPTKKGDGT